MLARRAARQQQGAQQTRAVRAEVALPPPEGGGAIQRKHSALSSPAAAAGDKPERVQTPAQAEFRPAAPGAAAAAVAADTPAAPRGHFAMLAVCVLSLLLSVSSLIFVIVRTGDLGAGSAAPAADLPAAGAGLGGFVPAPAVYGEGSPSSVSATLGLDIDVATIAEGTPARAAFESDFIRDVAAILGVTAA